MQGGVFQRLERRVFVLWLSTLFSFFVLILLMALGVSFPLHETTLVIAVVLAVNILFYISRHVGWGLEHRIWFQPMIELALITFVVFATGGFASVFSFLYLIPITTTSILLSLRLGIRVATLASLLYLALTIFEYYGYIHSSTNLGVNILQQDTGLYLAVSVLLNRILFFFAIAVSGGWLSNLLRKANAELSEQYQKISAIFSSFEEGVLSIDKEGCVMEMNRSAEQLFGQSRDQMIAEPCGSFFDRFGEKKFARALVDTTNKGRHFEVRLQNQEGRIFDLVLSPLYRDHEFSGRVVVLRDITKQKEVDRMKTEFISIASHQLRTPLTSIKLYIELLQKASRRLKKEEREYVDTIESSTEQMIDLVNELLNVSRLETGRLKVRSERSDLSTFLRKTVAKFRGVARQRGCSLKLHLPKKSAQTTKIDAGLLSQVMYNLLSNAIRYSPKSCTIHVWLEQDADGAHIIRVVDKGIGIPPEAKHRMFEKFYRADNAVKQETLGSGLGLHVARMIMDASGGRIWFESELGKGTTFFVQIPKVGMRQIRQ